MIKVCMEVHEGAAPRKVAVRAGSISRAVSITKGRYPDCDVRVVFPIDPAEFFIRGTSEWDGDGRMESPPVGSDRQA